MTDQILFVPDAVSLMRGKLERVAADVSAAAKRLRGIDIPDYAGGDLRINVSGRMGQGISYSGNTVETCVRSLSIAAEQEAEYIYRICSRLQEVERIFSETERGIVERIEAIDKRENTNQDAAVGAEDTGDVIVSKRTAYMAVKTAPVLGAAGKTSTNLPLSKEDAQDMMNFFLGDGMVSQFLFWYSANDKVEKYWKVLTGDTKGMSQAEVNAALAEFVLVAKLINAAIANDQVDKLQGVINSLSDWGSDAEKSHNKDQILSFAKDTLGLSVEKAVSLDIDLEAVTVGTLTLLTAKEVLIDVPQAQYAQSILNRLETTGKTNVTIDMVINNQATAADMALESTVSDSNKKKATKYAQMLYDIEKSLS